METLYERVGGEGFFFSLVERFYSGVVGDPLLRPLYPDGDDGLEEARLHLEWFLVQYWGGPARYHERRGEPRLSWPLRPPLEKRRAPPTASRR